MLTRHKVLVQWLPSQTLREIRSITLGLKAGCEVQQQPITIHNPLFPKAAALAALDNNGTSVLKVGFTGTVRPNGQGFILDAAPPVQDVYYFEESPTEEELIAQAIRLSKLSAKDRKMRIAQFAKLRTNLLADYENATKAAAEHGKETSPFYSLDAFNAVALDEATYLATKGFKGPPSGPSPGTPGSPQGENPPVVEEP